MGEGEGGYSWRREGESCWDEIGSLGLFRTEARDPGFGLEGVMGDDLILDESGLAGENNNNSSVLS